MAIRERERERKWDIIPGILQVSEIPWGSSVDHGEFYFFKGINFLSLILKRENIRIELR